MEHADEERGAVNSIKPVKSDWDKKLFWTLIVVNLAGIMERADEALLPAVYREVGLSLHASPTKLGTLTLLRSVVQVLCFPSASYLSITHNRANIIAIGAIMWAIATFFVGASTSYLMIAVARSLNGIGLALVIPAIDSLVADAAHAKKRGLAFGWLQFTGSLGSVFGTVFALLLAGTTVFGIAGWRASFYIIGAASALVGLLVYQFAVDPRSKKDESGKDGYDKTITPSSALKQTVKEAIYVIKIPTFRAIVLQGVAGSFPWAALTFASMWLELIGFSHNVTAAIVGIFSVSSAIGGLLGGRLGDLAARAFPNAGRVMLAQFSSGIGIPFGAIVLLVLPYKSSTISGVEHGVILFLTGLLMSWCATGTNKPIFAEIVPEKMRTSIYALDRSFESLLASFAPTVVGLLAQHVFGYVSSSQNGQTPDVRNAKALGKALFVAYGIPFVACCLLYSILYWTYPRDRARVQPMYEQHQGTIHGTTEDSLKPGYCGIVEVNAKQEEATQAIPLTEIQGEVTDTLESGSSKETAINVIPTK